MGHWEWILDRRALVKIGEIPARGRSGDGSMIRNTASGVKEWACICFTQFPQQGRRARQGNRSHPCVSLYNEERERVVSRRDRQAFRGF